VTLDPAAAGPLIQAVDIFVWLLSGFVKAASLQLHSAVFLGIIMWAAESSTIISFKEEGNMAKAMTKSQIADQLAKKADIKKAQAVTVLDEIAKLAYKEAKNSFTLPGIGKIVLMQRKARMGRNPQTGQAIKIPAKKVVKFRVAKAAKDAILGKK
jgi:DNA-binding protein HU-beta